MLGRRACLVLTALALISSAVPARAERARPTPPGGSAGTASAESTTGIDGYHISYMLHGTLRLGEVTREGWYVIRSADGDYTRFTLNIANSNEPFVPIGTCTSTDTVREELAAPAAAVVRCKARFPEQDRISSTTLVFVLPDEGQPACRQCGGHRYEGSYVG